MTTEERKLEEDTTEYLVKMERALFSRCGMRCDQCLVYRPNVEREDRRAEICTVWKKIWREFDPEPDTVICDGCCCEREGAVQFSPGCKARKCVMERDIAHCGYCPDYPCSIFPAEPSAEETAHMIDVEGRWTWEDERLMAAYACKANMDAFRKNRQEK